MLVLSRKEGERIVIDGSIVITIVETRGGRVRVGVEAPKEVSVLREEVARRSNSSCPPPVWHSSAVESRFHPEFA